MTEITPEEVGCQINLITGEHYGPCKGSCKPDPDELRDDFVKLLKMIRNGGLASEKVIKAIAKVYGLKGLE